MTVANGAPQVVHGLSIPLGKLGFYLPRTISRGVMSSSSERNDGTAPFTLGSRVSSFGIRRRHHGAEAGGEAHDANASGLQVFSIGGSIIPKRQEESGGVLPDRRGEPNLSGDSSTIAVAAGQGTPPAPGPATYIPRTIRFPDEPAPDVGLPRNGGTGSSPEP